MAGLPEPIAYLLRRYRDPSHNLYLDLSTRRILNQLLDEGVRKPIDRTIIEDFRRSLSWFSRVRERRILRGRKRYNSFRSWRSHSPQTILAIDLCFLNNLPDSVGRNVPIFIAIDTFSRMTLATVQANNSSKATFQSYCKLLPLFLRPDAGKNYSFVATDRGGEFRSANFRQKLEQKYGTKLYHTHVGPHPKVRIFFSIRKRVRRSVGPSLLRFFPTKRKQTSGRTDKQTNRENDHKINPPKSFFRSLWSSG